MAVNMSLVLPRDGTIGVDIRTVLDLLDGQFDRELAQRGIRLPQSRKRQENFATGEPIASIDDQPANYPTGVFEKKVAGAADATGTAGSIKYLLGG